MFHGSKPEELSFTLPQMRKSLLHGGRIYRSNNRIRFTLSARMQYWNKHGFPTHWNDLSIARRLRLVKTIMAVQTKELLQSQRGWDRRSFLDMIPEIRKQLSLRMQELEKQVTADEIELGRTRSTSWADTLRKRNQRRTNFISILEGTYEYLQSGPLDWK